MELVKGVPITKYCDEKHLTARERLELFLPVCHAVQHAHQKGIIHRDLKPSNVLVALYDDRPVPKVIDFGVAKATSQKLTEKTMFTRYGQIVGTLEYMSPEQAQVNQLDIDTRSDIYSLGVLLYELLTGSTPFDKETLRTAAFEEMLRIIREDEPPKPSTRLSSSDALPSIAGNRNTEPHKLSALLRGDIDWIVMKALEKDRTRRYETANGFAADIGRFLNDEPVEACPPSATYRFKKFARRNKAVISTTAVVALSLILGTGVATWQATRATQEQRRANRLLTSERLARKQLIEAETRETRQNAQAFAAIEAALAETDRMQQQAMWSEALAAVRRAESLIPGIPNSDPLAHRVQQRLNDLLIVAKLERIRGNWLSVGKEGLVKDEDMDRDYALAFREYGIDIDKSDSSETADRIRAGSVSLQLATALDHWAVVRHSRKDEQGRKRLLTIARSVDNDDWRNRLRDILQQFETEPQTIAKLAESTSADELPPVTLIQLASALYNAELIEKAIDLLERGQQKHPSDFWINMYLGSYCVSVRPQRWEDSLRFYSAAVALRPQSPRAHRGLGYVIDEKAHRKGHQLMTERERDIGLLETQEAVRLNP